MGGNSRPNGTEIRITDMSAVVPSAPQKTSYLTHMTPNTTNAATITVPETLALLDGQFASVATGVADDRYVLWLGSGISFGRVDGLRQVVAKVLEFLRVEPSRATQPAGSPGHSSCVDIAPLRRKRTPNRLHTAGYAWPDCRYIVVRLCNNYARLLTSTFRESATTFLLWEAVDLRATSRTRPNRLT